MIAMAALDLLTAAKVDTKGGAEEGRLDIMGHDSVAAEDYLDIATSNEVGNVTACARVDNGRAKYKENLAVFGSCLFHLTGNFVDRQDFDSFRGDIALHEGECFPFTCSFKWMDANTIMPNHDLITYLYFVHGSAKGPATGPVNDNGHIHLNTFHIHPLTFQPYLCRQVGGRVEFCRKDPILLDGQCLDIASVNKDSSKLLQFG